MKQARKKSKATSTKKEKSAIPTNFNHRLREVLFITTAAVAIFLIGSLFTYHQTDPGWSATGTSQHIANAGGRVGAWFSDAFLYIFGYSAYLFPFMVLYGAWALLLRHRKDEEFESAVFIIRVIGFILILVSVSGLASMHLPAYETNLPYDAGGILGDLVGPALEPTFNTLGTSLLLLAFGLSGVTLFTGLSWLGIMDNLGAVVIKLYTVLVRFVAKAVEHIRESKAIAHERKLERQAAKEQRAAEKLALKQQKLAAKESQKAKKIEPKITAATKVAAETIAPAPKIMKAPAPVQQVEVAAPTAPVFNATGDGTLPSIGLLNGPSQDSGGGYSEHTLSMMSQELEARLAEFGVKANVVAVQPGPVITRFELDLAPGIKVSKLTGLAKDLARSLSVVSVRVVEVIPGKSFVGIEIPNEKREMVVLSEIIASKQFEQARSSLSMSIGKDIAGNPVIVDLAKMPHLLVAGTTGAGKSVGLNAMLLSLLYKSTPKEVRMILVDPKMLELSIYDGIPHLLAPVVTDMKEAANALRWCVAEMERRYKLMAAMGVRNLAGFNKKIADAEKAGTPLLDPLLPPSQEGEPAHYLQELPFIVVLVDEFADMMMVVGKKVEQLIARIAQKARAAGIHLILATQRPSVDVITGLIKANVPTRMAYQVSSRVDSRTILDQQGAEHLLGHGDMLYLPPGTGVPVRVHGCFVADQEVHDVVSHLKQNSEPDYLDAVLTGGIEGGASADVAGGLGLDDEAGASGEGDPLYDKAVYIVTESRRASISGIQRRLKIGYNRAARLVEDMEAAGIVTPMGNNGTREVVAPPPPKEGH